MTPTPDYDAIATALAGEGHVWLTGFAPQTLTDALAVQARSVVLQPATTGRGPRPAQTTLRGDSTCWLDPASAEPAESAYWRQMQALRQAMNERLMLGLEELEAHYALYPPGAGYVRHRDRFRDEDTRVLSSVLYLNQDWQAADGGALRLYLADGEHDVVPLGGSLVLFLSAEIEHAVLPARRERLSIAGWFRRRALLA